MPLYGEDNVVKIGDYTFKRCPDEDYKKKECKHLNPVLDDHGGIITCGDCGANLSPYWVMREILYTYQKSLRQLDERWKEIQELTEKHLVLKAAKKVESAWRSKNMLPSCPHCHRGIRPEDGLGGEAIGKDYEMALRRRDMEAKELSRRKKEEDGKD